MTPTSPARPAAAGPAATAPSRSGRAPRILAAGFFHETHSFIAAKTTLTDFTINRGAAILARAGDGGAFDAFLEVAAAEGWEVIPVADYNAQPAGPIEHAIFEGFAAELLSALKAALAEGPLDGIWLALHGAALTDEIDDLEGELLARIRAVPGAGALPLWVVFDLHANFTDQMARHATGLVGYRENPHVDTRDAAVRSARFLARSLAEQVPTRVYATRAPVIWPPTGTGTADQPMRDLEAMARRLEAETPEFWAVNVIAGFAFSDVADAGVAFSIVTSGDEAPARAALDLLVAEAMRLRDHGQPQEWDLDAAILDITSRPGGPYVIVEPADNIGGGAPGDCTTVLRALLRHGLEGSAVAIADPLAVAALKDAAIGETRRIAIGGRGSPFDPGPVELEVTLVSRSDGRFRLEDRQSHMIAALGENIRMGESAVVTAAPGITILLTSVKTAPNDLGQWRSQGVEPTGLRAIGVKAAVAHRRAYDKIQAGSYTVATPGPTTSNLHSLPYRRLRRPIHPLDLLPETETGGTDPKPHEGVPQ